MQNDCVFCEKVVQGDYIQMKRGCIIFEPLNPVTPGHLLVVPVKHVTDFGSDQFVSADVMEVSSIIARLYGSYNIITSKGSAATQSVLHLHVHIVPRTVGDGLHLPWTNQDKYSRPMDTPPKRSESGNFYAHESKMNEFARRLKAEHDGGGR